MFEEFSKLKNGTDIRGIAIKHDKSEVNLSLEAVRAISMGFIKYLEKKTGNSRQKLTLAVGMDSRLSGPIIKEELINTMKKAGCTVYDCGLATTPAMFMATLPEVLNVEGAVMITASHLPYYYNGFKFFTKEGGFESSYIDEMISYAEDPDCTNDYKGIVVKKELIKIYSEILVNYIRDQVSSVEDYEKPLKGLKIIIDAGNGAGGFFADMVLAPLGADTKGSQFIEPDGNFPNHIPNPEQKEAMESIKAAVLKSKADLGIIFDADVDRVAIVDSRGDEINRNSLIALISSIVLEEHPSSVIVTDSVTSDGLKKFINEHGGKHYRFKRGYRNVINEAKRLNSIGEKCYLAMETSGHAALKDNYFLDDGAFLAAKILVKMAKLKKNHKNIESLIEDLIEPKDSREIRIKINNENFKEYGARIIHDLVDFTREVEGFTIEKDNYEGVKVNCSSIAGDGWFLLRLSLHEPVLALNIESNREGGVNTILNKLTLFLERFTELDKINKTAL